MAPAKSSTTKSTRKKSTKTATRKSRKKVAAEDSDTAVAVEDSEFGAGVIDDIDVETDNEKPEKETAKKERKPRRRKKEEVEEVDSESSSSEQEASSDSDAVEGFNAEDSGGESSNDDSSGDDEGKPKRRRRRRRRGKKNEGSNSNQQQQQGGKRRRRGGDKRGGGGNRPQSKFEKNAPPAEPVPTSGTTEGILELHPKGYGFLRAVANDYGARETDTFVSSSFVEKHNLREGLLIRGEIGPGTRGQGPRLLEIESIDGRTAEEFEQLEHFDNLTPINPFEQIKLETGPTPVTMRVMDLLTPIAKGQRALLVAPPRSGKTMLLQDIANAVSENHPEIHLICLLIDERPEEVTEMRRTIKGDVIASSMDEDVESHVRISQLIFERGKRLAEAGKDCFILMDSITRTARAFNKWMRGDRNSKIGTGGLDVRALDIPRKMFGTARRFDEGGSLTVCATALIDTGSRMDEAIFQEFKGTGNMELVLSRELAERRIWPAMDISRSGTRREEKILDPAVLEGVTMLRRSLVSMGPTEAMDQLIRTLTKFDSNQEFLARIRNVL